MILGTFSCIDSHTCGNPVRLITSGHPNLVGRTMSEKRLDFIERFDWIRQALMFEPRGHDMMSGAFLYPPCQDNADAAILFVETSGCLPMCGHGTIGVVTAGLQAGLLQPKVKGQLILDVPAGQVEVTYEQEANRVTSVTIHNVASFLMHQGLTIEVPELGELVVDISYGGNFYIIVEPQPNFPGIEQWDAGQVLRFSPLVREAVNRLVECIHPLEPTVRGASHVLWTGNDQTTLATKTQSASQPYDGINAVFYGDKGIDRSPCGTGTSARMAQRYAKGQLSVGDTFVHQSYIGSQFVGKILAETTVGSYRAIKPSIRGWAHVFGNNQITIDDSDPYAFGFQVK